MDDACTTFGCGERDGAKRRKEEERRGSWIRMRHRLHLIRRTESMCVHTVNTKRLERFDI